MKTPLIILSLVLILGTLTVFLYNLKSRKYDVLSMRNLFLLGFLHFFGVGTYFTATTGFGTDLYVAQERGQQLLFVSTIAFVAAFALTQWIGVRWGGLRRVIPGVSLPVTQLGVNLGIVALLGGAFVGAVIPNTGYTTAVITQFRGGMAAGAMALATYNLLARKFNPIAWGVFFATLGIAGLLSTVGDIGRRNLLSIVLAIAWMWFYFSLRYKPAGATMLKMGTLMAAGFFALVVYAGFRGQGVGEGVGKGGFSLETRISQFVEAITNPSVASSDVRSSVMSDAPTNSMFIMENYPEQYSYDPFNGAKFILVNPIPRFMWPDKPKGLGIIVQEQLQSPANLGVGILGHGWAEGGIIGVIGYAIFFAIITTGVDNVIRQRVWNPYFLAAIGSSLGNVYALARGETSLFLLQVMLAYFGVIIILYPLKLFLGPLIAASTPLLTDANRPFFEPEPEYAYDEPPPSDEHEHSQRADAYPRPTPLDAPYAA